MIPPATPRCRTIPTTTTIRTVPGTRIRTPRARPTRRGNMGPAKMKPEVVAKIYADVQKVLAEPSVKENLSGAGVEPLSGNGAALSKLITSDLARYAQLAKSANIKAE